MVRISYAEPFIFYFFRKPKWIQYIADYPKLKKAGKKQLLNWKLTGGGLGVRWEDLDEDLSIRGFIKTAALNDAIRSLQGRNEDEQIVK